MLPVSYEKHHEYWPVVDPPSQSRFCRSAIHSQMLQRQIPGVGERTRVCTEDLLELTVAFRTKMSETVAKLSYSVRTPHQSAHVRLAQHARTHAIIGLDPRQEWARRAVVPAVQEERIAQRNEADQELAPVHGLLRGRDSGDRVRCIVGVSVGVGMGEPKNGVPKLEIWRGIYEVYERRS